jgi:hypothetical protein
LQTLLGSISLLSSNHLDETETTRLLGVGVNHDGAVLNITVFLKKTGDIGFGQTGVDASDEEVGAGVLGALLIIEGLAGVRRGTGELYVSTLSKRPVTEQTSPSRRPRNNALHTDHRRDRSGNGCGCDQLWAHHGERHCDRGRIEARLKTRKEDVLVAFVANPRGSAGQMAAVQHTVVTTAVVIVFSRHIEFLEQE